MVKKGKLKYNILYCKKTAILATKNVIDLIAFFKGAKEKHIHSKTSNAAHTHNKAWDKTKVKDTVEF